MKQTVEEAAEECRRTTAQSMGVYAQYHSIDECPNHGLSYDELVESAFIKGAEWKTGQMKEKAIESYIENCEYKSDWCCDCADVCIGRDCPTVKQFIEKLNS